MDHSLGTVWAVHGGTGPTHHLDTFYVVARCGDQVAQASLTVTTPPRQTMAKSRFPAWGTVERAALGWAQVVAVGGRRPGLDPRPAVAQDLRHQGVGAGDLAAGGEDALDPQDAGRRRLDAQPPRSLAGVLQAFRRQLGV